MEPAGIDIGQAGPKRTARGGIRYPAIECLSRTDLGPPLLAVFEIFPHDVRIRRPADQVAHVGAALLLQTRGVHAGFTDDSIASTDCMRACHSRTCGSGAAVPSFTNDAICPAVKGRTGSRTFSRSPTDAAIKPAGKCST